MKTLRFMDAGERVNTMLCERIDTLERVAFSCAQRVDALHARTHGLKNAENMRQELQEILVALLKVAART